MKIYDVISGLQAPGEWALSEDMDASVSCPTCGAEEDAQCSFEDPDRPGFGIEVSNYVHVERLNSPEPAQEGV